MKLAYMVVFDIPASAPEPTPEQRARVQGILSEVIRKHTEDTTEVTVLPHALTPAEVAALP